MAIKTPQQQLVPVHMKRHYTAATSGLVKKQLGFYTLNCKTTINNNKTKSFINLHLRINNAKRSCSASGSLKPVLPN